MSAKSQVVGAAANLYLSSRPVKYALHSFGRVVRGGQRQARLYYRVDDPYSHLLAQVAQRLVSAFQLRIEIIPVAQPTIAANPAPDMLLHHAIRDAAILAERYGLSFPLDASAPPEDRVRRAHAVLLKRRPAEEQQKIAVELGESVWRDDGIALAATVERYGSVSGEEVSRALDANYAALERAGHYQPGMLYYGGEWYWGVDRLHHLEERLRREGLEGSIDLASERSPHLGSLVRSDGGSRRRLEAFVSFRSPYSYLSIPQLIDLRDRYGLDVVVRPVLPMVMRGLAVPLAKRLALVNDAKREADRLGIPFGHVCDPLGKGSGYCMAVFFNCAVGKGIELEFARSAMQGIWSEARNVAHVPDLVFLAERAGISRAEVLAALEDPSWKEQGEANRQALTEMGLWGVPSFRMGPYATWGQDRIPLIEAEIAHFSTAD
ncbi:MAG: 2-hydroxychromene-2-carboxylate isomerase [Myxococcales bacterium]|nr:MAG: 2-hydroxychromene-2-carboxylate isomerase [Myxococcales bacterium]